MGMANIDALLADIAKNKESLRIAQQSLANIDPKYKMNQAYIAKLKDQVEQLQSKISTDTATLQETGNAAPVNPTRANTGESAYTDNTKTIQTPYDDEGNLNPGYKINEETGQPYYAGPATPAISQPTVPTTVQVFDDGSKLETFSDGATLATDSEGNQTFNAAPPIANSQTPNQTGSVASAVDAVRPQQTISVARNSFSKSDWRLRLSLAPGATYLYGAAKEGQILYPLKGTDGVIFPYTPSIQTAYRANYDATDITHSNYKMYFYKNSNVDEIQITADFTAQDTTEANYLLAVIHFFRSVTKMFYGQDGSTGGPKAGTPPPLCYLNGYGQYQFNNHAVLITNFTYNLPNDVDYIRAGPTTTVAGQPRPTNSQETIPQKEGFDFMKLLRKSANRLTGNGKNSSEPAWKNYANQESTYVPTKLQIQLGLVPIVTRNEISKNFSLEKYATGELLKGNQRKTGGGIW